MVSNQKQKRVMNFLIFIALLFSISALLIEVYSHFVINNTERLSNIEYDANCENMNIFNTSYCLRNQLIVFYKYNLSNIGKDLNFEKLKKEGGVCSHFAKWYYEKINKTKFNAQEVSFAINETLYHKVTIISDNEGYCLLDQNEVGCVKFARSKDE